MSADTIARLKITLDEVKPAVLRRIEVPLNIRLDRLHLAIQAAMGWSNSHLLRDPRPRRRMGRSRPRWGRRPARRAQGTPRRRARGCRHEDAPIPLRFWRRLGAHDQ